MTERKMCKFYNLNVPERRSGEAGGNQNHGNDDEDERNLDNPLEPYVPPHEHKLEYSYWMWFSRRSPSREPTATTTGYGQALRLVGRVASVEQWWGLYTHLARPSELPPLSDLHLFKLGIKPMWEDPYNVNGGKWVVRLRKTQTGRAWEDLCMAMLGEQFMVGPELCGVVLSVRFQEDHLAVWHRTAGDTAMAARVRDALRRILQLPASVPIEYKAHRDCLRATTSRHDAEARERRDSREPRDQRSNGRGEARDGRGEGRDGRGEARDTRGEERDSREETRDGREEARDSRGEERDSRGEASDSRREARDSRGEARDGREGRGDIRDGRGETRDGRGETRDERGETHDGRGETRDGRGETRDGREETRDERADTRDARPEARDGKGEARERT